MSGRRQDKYGLIYFIIDFILHIDVHLAEAGRGVRRLGVRYFVLILFCETGTVVTPFLPGDSLLLSPGRWLRWKPTISNVHVMVALMLIAAIVGDAVNCTIGRLFGEKLFSIRIRKFSAAVIWIKPTSFMKNTAVKHIVLARFGIRRQNLCAVCGRMGHMSYRHFAALITSSARCCGSAALCLRRLFLRYDTVDSG